MREKIIDIALIVTLIIVAFGITWTLLTLNRSQARPPAQQPTTAGSPVTGPQISPIPIERQSAPRPQGVAELQDNDTGREAGERAVIAPEPQEPSVADPQPLPPGPVQLERVGFSFVTGGAGACGVVLEPWTHVAVSRELLAAYGCGAEITITLDEEKGGRGQVQAIIGDTMNPVHSRTVNIYVSEDEPALEYGITSGVLRP